MTRLRGQLKLASGTSVTRVSGITFSHVNRALVVHSARIVHSNAIDAFTHREITQDQWHASQRPQGLCCHLELTKREKGRDESVLSNKAEGNNSYQFRNLGFINSPVILLVPELQRFLIPAFFFLWLKSASADWLGNNRRDVRRISTSLKRQRGRCFEQGYFEVKLNSLCFTVT